MKVATMHPSTGAYEWQPEDGGIEAPCEGCGINRQCYRESGHLECASCHCEVSEDADVTLFRGRRIYYCFECLEGMREAASDASKEDRLLGGST